MPQKRQNHLPVEHLTANSIPTGLTLEYAAARAIGIQDYDPQMIEALTDELKDPDSDIDELSEKGVMIKSTDSNIDELSIKEELELYRKAQFYVRKMRNEASEWLVHRKETKLVIDNAVYQSTNQLGPDVPDLDLSTTTYTLTSLYDWFADYDIYVEGWSDDEARGKLKGNTSTKRPRAVQEQKVTNLHALVAILANEVAKQALSTETGHRWLDKRGKIKKQEFAEYLSTVGFDGLSDDSIGDHIAKGIGILKNGQSMRSKNLKEQPFGLKHLKF